MIKKLSKTNQSVEKTLQIIEIMSEAREPMRLQDVSLKADLPMSTALRLINTLVNFGYANQDPVSLRYSLSLKFAHIGSLVGAQVSIRDTAHPIMANLAHMCQESTCIAIEEDMEAVYIDVIDGPDGMLRITQRIGKRAPMHSTGVGKVLLQNYDSKQLTQLIAVKGLQILTPNTINTHDELLSEISKIRRQGYALDNEECELGARCIAAGIKDYTGKIVAGISVSGPISRMTAEKIGIITPIIMDSADSISRLLGYESRSSDPA